MCGIVGCRGGPVGAAVEAISHRGPDGSGTARCGDWELGHVRLAVVDPRPRSDQPFLYGRTVLVFNGQIWNWRELRSRLESEGGRFETEGDTETLAAALDRWGEGILPELEGMFAFAWWDGAVLRLARDRFGEVPCHWTPTAFGSELKALLRLRGVRPSSVRWVPPGSVITFREGEAPELRRWYRLGRPEEPPEGPEGEAARLRRLLGAGVLERSRIDARACTLLSGGIDSSAIAALLAEAVPGLVCYVAKMGDSEDLAAARRIASRLGLRLSEVEIPPPSAEDLGRVVSSIEVPFKAQIEIGWPCLILARAISSDGFKVVFSGEGSDELWGAYKFAWHSIASRGWLGARRELFEGQHRKNFARCNKAFMSHGVECRLPFLSTPLVERALSLPIECVQGRGSGTSGPGPAGRKLIMSRAFSDLVEAAERPRVAFQDGLGMKPAAAAAVADPARFYRSEFATAFRGVKP